MIRIVTYEGQPAAQLLDRAAEVKRDVTQAVEAIVENVRLRGDEAVLDYCEAFDGARPDGLLVPEEELDAAVKEAAAVIDHAVEYGKASKNPSVDDVFDDVYA